MNNIFTNLINALSEIWKNIGVSQKISIVLVGVLTLGATAAIVYMGSRPDWQVLYAGLDTKTAAKIYDIVSGSEVPVKLTDGGRTIMVPNSEVYKMRLKTANEGVATERSGTGLEIFDNMKLGLTDKQQQVAFQRAIQGELERMICAMPGISSAKIILTLPQKSVFRKDKQHPSASVMLMMQPGRSATSEQVNSIRYLVSSAVTGMNAQDVTITDSRGTLLVRQVAEDEVGNGDSSGQMEMSSRLERQLKEKAESILRPIVGPEKVVAVVSCDIDFDNIDRVTELYDSEKAVIISEKTVTEENSKMGGSSNGGKVGTASNMANNLVDVKNPSAQVPEEKMSQEQKKTAERKYVVPKTVEKKTMKGGRIKKLTVAVSIAKKADGKSWSDAEKEDFKELVSKAVGIGNYFSAEDLKKSPVVTVKEMDFIVPDIKDIPQMSMPDKLAMNVERVSKSPLVRPVAGFILLLVLYRIFRKYFNKTSVEGTELSLSGGGAPAAVYGEDVKRIETAEEKQHSEIGDMMDSIQEKANSSPQTVANIMEKWLAADQN
ncbi:MAG: flagellar M-ring protein FliF [Lentisphaerae bacterium GWF2_44_16]|nr:MAG: flagellar M-ring protein FliF [Lentisphaerae bacterium GWF2_44_16]